MRKVILMMLAVVSSSAMATDITDLYRKGCSNCHTTDSMVIVMNNQGPAWMAVAAKYRGDASAEAKLIDKVANGGGGVWGSVPMPAQKGMATYEDIKSLVKFVLSLKAEWVTVEESKDSTFYADFASMRKNGDRVKMWYLTDYKTLQTSTEGVYPYIYNTQYMSSKTLGEYDCKEDQSRSIALSTYAENMGKGKEVHNSARNINYEPGKWKPIFPNSIGEALWEAACGMKR